MSRPQEPHRPFFQFGNPFRMILPKGSYLSPMLVALLNAFEQTLAQRLRKLKPTHKDHLLSLSWMKLAMELLCETHNDIKTLITKLELPVCDWDDKWIDVYLNNSVKLLDICIAFSSEISRLNQGHLLLQCALHKLDSTSPTQLIKGRSSLDSWTQHINSKNSRMDSVFGIIETLIQSLHLPKVKNSAKGKVLMCALYGVKVQTVFTCSVFAAVFTGSAKKLTDLPVPGTLFWATTFSDLQTIVNGEMRGIFSNGKSRVLKELEEVNLGVKDVYPMIQDGTTGPVEEMFLQNIVTDLGEKNEKFSSGLDLVTKEVDGFFRIVLHGRDALLGNLRESDHESMTKTNVEEEAVR